MVQCGAKKIRLECKSAIRSNNVRLPPMSAKRKVILTQEQQQSIRAAVKVVKIQLRAINPAIQQPTNRAQRKAIRRNPDLLKPKWHREITKHLSDVALPHCRTGNKLFQKGRNDGFFHGGLLRDKEAAESQSNLTNKIDYLHELEEAISSSTADKIRFAGALTIEQRRDFLRGYKNGMKWAKCQELLASALTPSMQYRLWKLMPSILARCTSIPELFQLVFRRPARIGDDYDKSFRAFQKLCLRLGIKLRVRGRPRKQ